MAKGYHLSFEKAYSYGRELEQLLWALAQRKYPKAELMKGNFGEFDLRIPELNRTYEIKRDSYAPKSGLAFIEYEDMNGESGIKTTKADGWMIGVGDALYTIEVETLRWLVRDRRFPVATGGNEGKSKGYLVPLETLASSGKVEDLREKAMKCGLWNPSGVY